MFWRYHTVDGSLIVIIGPALDHAADIDQERSADYRCTDPLVLRILYLQSAYLILEQDSEKPVISVGPDPIKHTLFLILLIGRIVHEPHETVRPAHMGCKERPLQAQAHGQPFRDPPAQEYRQVPVSLKDPFELGLVLRPLVGSHQPVTRYDLRMVRAKVQSEVHALVPVMLVIGELPAQGSIAPEYVGPANMDPHFLFFRQVKEILHHRYHIIKMILGDLMVLYIEETNLPAGVPDLPDRSLYQAWVTMTTYQRRDINDRDIHGGWTICDLFHYSIVPPNLNLSRSHLHYLIGAPIIGACPPSCEQMVPLCGGSGYRPTECWVGNIIFNGPLELSSRSLWLILLGLPVRLGQDQDSIIGELRYC